MKKRITTALTIAAMAFVTMVPIAAAGSPGHNHNCDWAHGWMNGHDNNTHRVIVDNPWWTSQDRERHVHGVKNGNPYPPPPYHYHTVTYCAPWFP